MGFLMINILVLLLFGIPGKLFMPSYFDFESSIKVLRLLRASITIRNDS